MSNGNNKRMCSMKKYHGKILPIPSSKAKVLNEFLWRDSKNPRIENPRKRPVKEDNILFYHGHLMILMNWYKMYCIPSSLSFSFPIDLPDQNIWYFVNHCSKVHHGVEKM